jgi:beta-glucanase (GH16 family)
MAAWITLSAAVSAYAAEESKTTASKVTTAGVAEKEFLPPLPSGRRWKLAWSDEFDGPTVDESKWEIFGSDRPQRRRDGWWVKEDAYLDGQGHLLLRTRQDGDRYTCGAVRTRRKFDHTYGYWVARCKFPEQPGHWPAFWTMPANGVGRVGDEGRDGTEIDIMEKAWLTDHINHALHWDGYGKNHKSSAKKIEIPGVSKGWHAFGLHWTKEQYVFYVDGKETWRTSAGGVSQVPEYAKLTEEIGPWAGDIKTAILPDYFTVDYVRVYDEAE